MRILKETMLLIFYMLSTPFMGPNHPLSLGGTTQSKKTIFISQKLENVGSEKNVKYRQIALGGEVRYIAPFSGSRNNCIKLIF